jgi:hypothetical protein
MAQRATATRAPARSPRRPAPAVPRAPAPRPSRTATITELRPTSRAEAQAAARRERRRWLAIGALVFVTPFVACVGVLEVVR